MCKCIFFLSIESITLSFTIDSIPKSIVDVFGTIATTMANITPLPNLSAASTTNSTQSFSTSTPLKQSSKPRSKKMSTKKRRLGPLTKIKSSATPRRTTYRSSHNAPNFSKYILAVQKYTHPSLTISRKTVSIINNFLGDVLDRMTEDAKRLSQTRGSRSLAETDMRTATRLLLGNGMARDGQAMAARCVADYQKTVANRNRAQLRRNAKKE